MGFQRREELVHVRFQFFCIHLCLGSEVSNPRIESSDGKEVTIVRSPGNLTLELLELSAKVKSSKFRVEVCDVRFGVGVTDPDPSWWW